MRAFIPNCLTLSNLVMGMFSIVSAFQGSFFWSAVAIVIAMVADALDGRAARYFQVSSDFGKELDSLCDLVSFGVAPAILAYVFLLKDFGIAGYIIATIFAVCGALRLARFNVNTTVVKGYFMGLPIPAAGCLMATFIMMGIKPVGWFFPIMMIIIAYLMVSTVKYPDFKGQGEKLRVVPGIISVGISAYILFTIPQAIVFVPFFFYASFGILNTIFGLVE